MKLAFGGLLCLFALCSLLVGQGAGNTAPASWQTFKLSEQNLSFELPKLPLRLDNSNPCTQTDVIALYAYT
ncbi:MAG TPA: hypothetical protein VGI80_08040, partial [Pyrinomonadaceae bacterium]